MRAIELWTGQPKHHFVAVVDIPPFPDTALPDVVVWGTRTFRMYALGDHGRPRYLETFAVVSLTPSPGRQRHDESCPDDCTVMHPPPPADHSKVETIHGTPIGEHTDLRSDGQQKDYLVLSAEERAKGFVRPVRSAYVHVGRPAVRHPLRDLTDEERARYEPFGYVKYEEYPPEVRKSSSVVGRFWTQADLDRVGKGCGNTTTMSRQLAETYARDPSFYSGTFCATCRQHFPVGAEGEFVWEGTDEKVGT